MNMRSLLLAITVACCTSCLAQSPSAVNSVHYSDGDFFFLELGMTCVRLDLSSGDNSFDLSPLDDTTNTLCYHMSDNVKEELHRLLDTVVISIPQFPINILGVGAGRLRLSHMAKQSVNLSWSAKYGGSLHIALAFESAGKEILGTFHGDINDAVLSIYLTPQVSDDAAFHAALAVEFNARVSIDGVNNQLVPRSKILHDFADAARNNLTASAAGIARGLLLALIKNVPQGNPTPSSDSVFFTQIQISEGHADISWLNSPVVFRYVDVAVENADPLFADSEERLILRLHGGWANGPYTEAVRVAAQGTQLVLPLTLHHLFIPGGLPLALTVRMDVVTMMNNQPKGVKTLGTVNASYPSPGYGNGNHQGVNGGIKVSYRIVVQP
jgi:hypothetical protein